MSVLKIKREDGTWEAIGGRSGESGVLIVTLINENKASHTSIEITDAISNGKLPVLDADGEWGHLIAGTPENTDIAVFSINAVSGDGSISSTMFYIDANGDCTITSAAVPVPTESDYGKFLSATPNGFVWITPIGGGNVPSAEGVEF